MCGIIGYIGDKNVKQILLSGLKKMEYRGYDSAGLALQLSNEIKIFKATGRASNLEKKIIKKKLKSTCGIAHTRWATHGEASIDNTHPHRSCLGDIQIVHNGIIENYQKLKSELTKSGHKFSSQTDTEVIAHLIEENYQGDLKHAVLKSLKKINGAFGLAIMHSKHKDEIVVAKLGSPLIIGRAKNESLVTSDVLSLPENIKKVIYLKDKELAVLKKNKVEIVNFEDHKITKLEKEIKKETYNSELENYPNFMLKEIFEQPDAIRRVFAGRLREGKVRLGGLDRLGKKVKDIKKVIIVACGTAKLAGDVGKYILEEYAGLETEVEFASEFRYRQRAYNPSECLVVAISQSGETADTKAAITSAKQDGCLTLGIINVVGSEISRIVDTGIYTHSGPEVAVASTKAFTSQIAALILLSLKLSDIKGMFRNKSKLLLQELSSLPEKIESVLHENKNIKRVAQKYSHYKNFAFLGRKFNFPVAFEGALKLKEISYIHAEGFASGELKHGPIALIDKNFPCVVICLNDSVYEKVLSNMEEIKARHGKIIALATRGDKKVNLITKEIIFIPKTEEALSPLLAAVALQLLAYHVAVILNRDVDKPRNLAKSVTVE